jgi:hypothetical protein
MVVSVERDGHFDICNGMKAIILFLSLFAMHVLADENIATDWIAPEGAVYNLCGDKNEIAATASWNLEKDPTDGTLLDSLALAKDKTAKAINSKFKTKLKPEDLTLTRFMWSTSTKVDGVPKIGWFQVFYLHRRFDMEGPRWKETFIHDGVLFRKEGVLIVFALPNGRALNPVLTEYDASKPGKWPSGDGPDPFGEK